MHTHTTHPIMPLYRIRFIPQVDEHPHQNAQPHHVYFLDPAEARIDSPANKLDQNTQDIMDAAATEKTKQRKLNYTAEFLVWAADQGLSEEDVLPSSETTLTRS
ncbi:hypothetical protein BT96DRAFT_1007857 [Gymnopus androsaceus JB14]|uniref:Uncharacterized protein n=1 Tax=Gymnopus androsaceus JB14 TaxID=1447944 RepID=A0A6A4GGX2_9AGAR|nr:hypothetical protein BT96DRAFT_1007857 [Gymnopus androsaceus JB14]